MNRPELPTADYHPAGYFTWDRERFPRLALQDGYLRTAHRRAGSDVHQSNALAALLGECYPAGNYNG